VYPLDLTSPDEIPLNNTEDPHPLPRKASSSRLFDQALAQVKSIAANTHFADNCAKCQAGLEVAKFLALAAPEEGPRLAVELCEHFQFSSTCGTTFSRLGIGAVITQVVSNADVGGLDGQVCFCYQYSPYMMIPDVTADALPKFPQRLVSASTNFTAKFDQLVLKAQT